MFKVGQVTSDQIKDIHDIQLHLSIELDSITSNELTFDEFMQHYQGQLFECHVLYNICLKFNRPLGCLVYCSDYSNKEENGIYLETFFLYHGIRDQGLGRLLLKTLCDEAIKNSYNFIKVYFLNNNYLRLLYKRMGFINECLGENKLILLEVSGRYKVNRFVESMKPNVNCSEVLEVFDSPVIKTETTSKAQLVNVFNSLTNKMSGFVETIIYNAQYGPTLLFKDFVGDTEILTPQIFKQRTRERMKQLKYKIGDILWEVSSLSCKGLIEKLENDKLIKNSTKDDNWEIGVLYRNKTNNFEYFKKAIQEIKSVKCLTLSKFEEIYKKVPFC